MVIAGKWYKSKKGALLQVVSIDQTGGATVTSHFSGNTLNISAHEASFLTEAPVPETGAGLLVVKPDRVRVKDYTDLYHKYPNIIPGSIYTVKNNQQPKHESYVRGKKTQIHGATRCKVKCDCGHERDIKVQDAWQVRNCLDCAKKARRKKLNEMLAGKRK